MKNHNFNKRSSTSIFIICLFVSIENKEVALDLLKEYRRVCSDSWNNLNGNFRHKNIVGKRKDMFSCPPLVQY